MSLFVVGDETGLLKVVDLSSKEVRTYGQQSRAHGVVGISNFGKLNNLCSVIRRNGVCEIWGDSVDDSEMLSLHSTVDCSIDDPAGCVSLQGNTGETAGSVIYGKSGTICSIEQSSDDNYITSTMDINAPLEACEPVDSGRFLFGGKENDVKLFDLRSQKSQWDAKNVPRDNLNLRIPVWITAIAAVDNNTFFTGTAYKHLRFYDIRCSTQPIKSIDFSPEFRISSMKYNSTLGVLYLADTAGNADIYDPSTLRRKFTLKGATGSVRCIALGNDGQHVATVGLDRHLRVYNGRTSKIVDEFYLKNRLNSCVNISGKGKTELTADETNSDSDDGNSSKNDDSSNDFLQEMQESDFE